MSEFNIQSILDGLSGGGSLADLLGDVDLNVAEGAIVSEYRSLAESAASDDDALAKAEAVGGLLDNIRSLKTEREAQAAERQSRVDALLARNADAAAAAEAAPAEEADVVAEAEAITQNAPEPVTAAVTVTPRTVNLNAIAAQNPPAAPAPLRASQRFSEFVIAASEMPGIAGGTGFENQRAMSNSIAKRLASKPKNRVALAQIKKNAPKELTLLASSSLHNEVLDYAVDESRLQGGSLIAAGGWCAPSETWYDICPTDIATNLFDLPTVTLERGGVRYTKGIDLAGFAATGIGFNFTEAQLIAGVTKPCVTIPCPTFLEERLNVDGVCIRSDIPMDKAYPEMVDEYVRTVLALHALTMQQLHYAEVLAGSGDLGAIPAAGVGATAAILDALELVAYNVRSAHLRSSTATVEMVLPAWVHAVVRSDLAKRNGYADPFSVSDMAINAWFGVRNIRVQWLDALFGAGTDAEFLSPGATAGSPDGWPESVQVIAYLAGTWVLAQEDVIDLEGVYDAASLAQNQYTRLFTEEGYAVINKCYNSFKFTVPICPNGNTGDQVAVTCPTS